MVRIAVAGEESLQPDHAARIRRADQHRAADAALDQADPAQDQRAHDALAEIGFLDQQRAQALRRDQQRFDVAFRAAIDQRDAAGELAELSEELSRPLIDDRRDMAEAVALGDRDMAGQDRRTCPARACRSRTVSRRACSCAPRRTGACARSPAPSAPEKSAHDAETSRTRQA